MDPTGGTVRHCQMEPFRDLDSVFSVGSASATRDNKIQSYSRLRAIQSWTQFTQTVG